MSASANSGHRAYSFDHLVSSPNERVREADPERFGGLEVDVKLDLGCLLDWGGSPASRP